jgi:hypothetical protein
MGRSTLALLRELELADADLAASFAEHDSLAGRVENVRQGALELEAFLARLPEERARLRASAEEARREEADARQALASAESAVRTAEAGADPARLRAARRALQTAQDLHHVTERRVADAREEAAVLERLAASSRRSEEQLQASARTLAAELVGRPRVAGAAGAPPPPGLAGVREWAGTARAALFVSRGGLARERETVVRQADELGAAMLGEPLVAVSVAAVACRVERELDD